MMFSNYHTHTTYCDGADTPEELVLEAIRLGCPELLRRIPAVCPKPERLPTAGKSTD